MGYIISEDGSRATIELDFECNGHTVAEMQSCKYYKRGNKSECIFVARGYNVNDSDFCNCSSAHKGVIKMVNQKMEEE